MSALVEDMGRDLEADLKMCDAARPGPWRNTVRRESAREVKQAIEKRCSMAVVDTAHKPGPGNVICYVVTGIEYHDDIVEARMIAAAREGWPAAIRRALAAEAEIVRLQGIIDGLAARVAEQSALLTRRAEGST